MKRVRAALRLKTIRSRIVSMELIIIIPVECFYISKWAIC